jgi:hypothetical protein
MSAPKKPDDGSREPTTYYQIEKNKVREGEEEEATPLKYPQLPRTNPWAVDLPPEELIDRTEDKSHG